MLRAHDVLRHRRLWRRRSRCTPHGAGLGRASLLGWRGALWLSLGWSLLIGLFSLRVRAIFFAMITLAVASAFQTLASQLSDITGGEDGLNFRCPRCCAPSFEPFETPVLGCDRRPAGRPITSSLRVAVGALAGCCCAS